MADLAGVAAAFVGAGRAEAVAAELRQHLTEAPLRYASESDEAAAEAMLAMDDRLAVGTVIQWPASLDEGSLLGCLGFLLEAAAELVVATHKLACKAREASWKSWVRTSLVKGTGPAHI